MTYMIAFLAITTLIYLFAYLAAVVIAAIEGGKGLSMRRRVGIGIPLFAGGYIIGLGTAGVLGQVINSLEVQSLLGLLPTLGLYPIAVRIYSRQRRPEVVSICPL